MVLVFENYNTQSFVLYSTPVCDSWSQTDTTVQTKNASTKATQTSQPHQLGVLRSQSAQVPQKGVKLKQNQGINCVEGFPATDMLQTGIIYLQLVDQKRAGEISQVKGPIKRVKREKYYDQISIQVQNQKVTSNENQSWPQQLLPHQVNRLKTWFLNNLNFPFPNAEQTGQEAQELGLQTGAIENFFYNARQRIWKPVVERVFKAHVQRLIQHLIDKHDTQTVRWVINDLRKGRLDCERIVSFFDDVMHLEMQEVGRRLQAGKNLPEALAGIGQIYYNQVRQSVPNSKEDKYFHEQLLQQGLTVIES